MAVVIFYAGHGIEVDGTNYLIPIDAKLRTRHRHRGRGDSARACGQDARAGEEAAAGDLDACRDNPFARTMKRTMASRVDRARPRQGRAADLGHADRVCGEGRIDRGRRRRHAQPVHRCAAQTHLTTPGPRSAAGVRPGARRSHPEHRQPAGAVRLRLARRATRSRSCPNARRARTCTGALPSATPWRSHRFRRGNAAWRDYELAAQINTKEIWDAFIETHPTGFYANMARAQRAKLIDDGAGNGPRAVQPVAPAADARIGDAQVTPPVARQARRSSRSRREEGEGKAACHAAVNAVAVTAKRAGARQPIRTAAPFATRSARQRARALSIAMA